MHIGVPKEIKNHEYRVGLVPASVHELVAQGHRISVQKGAGEGVGYSDIDYESVGAQLVEEAQLAFEADMVVKVKEPQPEECRMLGRGQVLFTFLHLAPDPQQTQGLLDSGCTALAYEMVRDSRGRLPLLAPMSEVAGRMSIQVGAAALQKSAGGRGVLLGGVPGTPAAHVLVIGGGVAGTHAAQMAQGMGARVTVLDTSLDRLRELDALFRGRVETAYASSHTLEVLLAEADLVVGAALVPGHNAPRLLRRDQLTRMRSGAVLVDISIDQGGCFETSRPTTHEEPTYTLDGVVHYCVANMPGAVPRTSTLALNQATLPYVLALARHGWQKACQLDEGLMSALSVHDGLLYCEPVARAQRRPCTPAPCLKGPGYFSGHPMLGQTPVISGVEQVSA